MNLFGIMDISASALQAERVRAEVIAANMANSETTRTSDGGPYQRQHVVFQAGESALFQNALTEQMDSAPASKNSGSRQPLKRMDLGSFDTASKSSSGSVSITGVLKDSSAPLRRYEPGHPDADAEGFVLYPDINPLTEMVDLMGATRSYGMNASAVQAEKSMVASSYEILK